MPQAAPRIGVLSARAPELAEAVREAGGEPVPLPPALGRPTGGVALAREWVADAAQVSCAGENLDALLLAGGTAEELAGLVISAVRQNLPTVAVPDTASRFSVALCGLGVSPLVADSSHVVVEMARDGAPRIRNLIAEFSLANALRAGVSAGGAAEVILHLIAIAREAKSPGFPNTARVLAPETPMLTRPGSDWLTEHGPAGLLAHLGDDIHDAPTVEGRLMETLPAAPPEPEPSGTRLTLIEGRASGAESLCRSHGEPEISGEVRYFRSEKFAVRAIEEDRVDPDSLLVIGGSGPRGGPGLLRLDRVAGVLEQKGQAEDFPVITDGIAPDGAGGVWISLFTPETARDSILGRLRDGDPLRIDLEESRLRAGIRADEISGRSPRRPPDRGGSGYAARYARDALPAFEGAGFE